MVNRCIFLIFVTQFVLCVVSSVLFGVWSEAPEAPFRWYLGTIARVSLSPCCTDQFLMGSFFWIDFNWPERVDIGHHRVVFHLPHPVQQSGPHFPLRLAGHDQSHPSKDD